MNNKLINFKKKNIVMIIIPFTENNWNLFDFRPDPDPLFPESDPHQNEADPKHCFFCGNFYTLYFL